MHAARKKQRRWKLIIKGCICTKATGRELSSEFKRAHVTVNAREFAVVRVHTQLSLAPPKRREEDLR